MFLFRERHAETYLLYEKCPIFCWDKGWNEGKKISVSPACLSARTLTNAWTMLTPGVVSVANSLYFVESNAFPRFSFIQQGVSTQATRRTLPQLRATHEVHVCVLSRRRNVPFICPVPSYVRHAPQKSRMCVSYASTNEKIRATHAGSCHVFSSHHNRIINRQPPPTNTYVASLW